MATIPGKWQRPGELWRKMRPVVRRLRGEMTRAESTLWEYLRKVRLDGYRFRRQHASGHFIVDFSCPAEKLVVETDGPIHDAQQEQDAARQAYLEQRGYTVLRFSNDEVMLRSDEVLRHIRDRLDKT